MTDFKLLFQRIEQSSISSNHTCRYVYTTNITTDIFLIYDIIITAHNF